MKVKLSDLMREERDSDEGTTGVGGMDHRRMLYFPATSATLKELAIGDTVTVTLTGEVSSLRDSEYGSEFCVEMESYEVKGKKGSNGVEESNDMDGLLDDDE